MNKKLSILTVLLILHAGIHSMFIQPILLENKFMVPQPKLKPAVQEALDVFEKALDEYYIAKKEYDRLQVEDPAKVNFSIYRFFYPTPEQQAYSNALSNFEESMEKLLEIDATKTAPNFMLASNRILYRKIFTDDSDYRWIPFADYKKALEQPDTYIKLFNLAQEKATAEMQSKFNAADKITQESIKNLLELNDYANSLAQELKSPIEWSHSI